MRVLAFASLLSCASAFLAPAGVRVPSKSRSALRMSVNDLVGGDSEIKGVWDPLGFSKVRKISRI
jgi:hypothetical protein